MPDISQRPGQLNIIYTQGDDLPISITLGFNATGYKINPQLDPLTFEDPQPIPFKTINPQTGKIELNFPRATFGALPLGTRTWCLTITSPENKVRKFLAGSFQIVKS